MLALYGPVAILAALTIALGLLVLGVTFVFGPSEPSPAKQSAYESGLVPIGPAHRRVPVRFYMVAVIFILFDIEAIYLYPWAVRFRVLVQPQPDGLGYAALAPLGVFLGVLVIGYIHIWRKGALEWH